MKVLPSIVLSTVLFCAAPPALAASSWNNPAGGNWGDAGNWIPAGVPGAADDVLITLDGTYAVTLNVAASIRSLSLGGTTGTQSLTISISALTLAEASSAGTMAVINMQGSTLGGAGTLDIDGALKWSGGTITGSGARTATVPRISSTAARVSATRASRTPTPTEPATCAIRRDSLRLSSSGRAESMPPRPASRGSCVRRP